MALHNALRDVLVSRGYKITYDWTLYIGEHGPAWTQGEAAMAEVSDAEVHGVVDAEVLFMLLPGGRGAHVELGVALGTETTTIVWTDDSQLLQPIPATSIFYHHPNVTAVMSTRDQMVSVIIDVLDSGQARMRKELR